MNARNALAHFIYNIFSYKIKKYVHILHFLHKHNKYKELSDAECVQDVHERVKGCCVRT